MTDEQARELAKQYIRDQLESIGNDYVDVVEFLQEEGVEDGSVTDAEAVAKHIRLATTELIEALG